MKKVKPFFHILKNSFFLSSHYYQKILRTPFGFSFKYFLSLLFLLNFIFLLSLGWRFHPKKILTILTAINSSLKKYPDDLVINIGNGVAFTNYNRPYFLWLDYQNKKKLLLVIDESALPEKIKIYNSLVLITSKDLVFNLRQQKNSQSLSIFPLSSFTNKAITKQEVSKIVSFLNRIINNFFFLYLAIAIITFIIIPLFSLLINLLYLTAATFVVFLAYKLIVKRRTHFKKAFQIGFHAITFPLTLDYFIITTKPLLNLKFLLPQAELLFPFSFLILISIFIFAGIYNAHHSFKDDKI